ncbi:acyl carrier protein [Actinocorallia sp. API 0066]|uniref:acyl carrier protein n=1 Tax=Actinocorallia sp. API 0066 TaxID=2896846 RepID=UPI001E3AE56A|nr:acyl carrier protein [Actinocorallia sp. API 0066]MCD0447591.1 acyl carrier protein [Actinocorallia sp. API 0066]
MPESASEHLTTAAIEQRLLGFLLERTKIEWEVGQDLFDTGVVSSLLAMELVVFVEKTFDVAVEREDLALHNFRTVRAMTDLVLRLGKATDA